MDYLIYAILIFLAYKLFSIYSSKDPKKSTPIDITITTNKSTHEYKNNNNEKEDNYEGTYYGSVKDEIPCLLKLKIKYRDGNKNITNRDIEVKKIGETFDGDYMLLAYCSMRNATRTFYASRIIELADLETGEFINDKLNYFKSKIEEYYISDEYIEMINLQKRLELKYDVIAQYKEVFEVISYIVRVDGSFTKQERTIVKEYVKKLVDIDDEMIDSILKSFGLITYQAFQAKIRKLDDSKILNFDMLEFAKEIVSTQKTSTDAEDKIISYLEKRQNK